MIRGRFGPAGNLVDHISPAPLTGPADARFMAGKSARLRPDSAIIIETLTIHCDRAA